MRNSYASVEDAIDALARGQMIVVVDSETREDEGDLVAAAEMVTPATVHFMISQGRGQLCMPVSTEIAERLELKPMVPSNGSLDQPRFAIPIDHRSCKSGISPLERAQTVRAIVDSSNGPDDFIAPGHIFPLIANAQGVIARQGHTEATVDLMRYAGLIPAGLLCEVCSNDGIHTADRNELHTLAREHGLLVVTIDDLVDYRRAHPLGDGSATGHRFVSALTPPTIAN